MSGLNQVQLIGHLGRDPEFTSVQSGRRFARLSLATSERWKDRHSGERRERTEWHRVVVFSEGLVSVLENYCRKGSRLFVQGKLQTRKWQDQNGADRYTTEIVLEAFSGQIKLLDSRGDDRPANAGARTPAREPVADDPLADLNDDIPF